MNVFSLKGLLLASMCIFIMTACNKDDDSGCGSLSKNIVGSWSLSYDNSQVEFKGDGTFIDAQGAILDVESNGVQLDNKTYATVGNDTIILSVSAGTQITSLKLPVTANECEKISIEYAGIGFSLNRN